MRSKHAFLAKTVGCVLSGVLSLAVVAGRSNSAEVRATPISEQEAQAIGDGPFA